MDLLFVFFSLFAFRLVVVVVAIVLDFDFGKEFLEVFFFFVVFLLFVFLLFFFFWRRNRPIQAIHEFLYVRIAISLHKGVFVPPKPHDQISIEEHPVASHHVGNVRDGRHVQRSSHDQQQVGLWNVPLQQFVKAIRKLFSKKDNVGLDVSPAMLAVRRLAFFHNRVFYFFGIRFSLAIDARGRSKVAVAFHQFVLGNPRQKFQPVNVLRIDSEQQVLVGQELQKVVRQSWLVLDARPELVGQRNERLWFLSIIVDLEDRLGIGEVILLEIVIQTSARASKVRDSGAYRKMSYTDV